MCVLSREEDEEGWKECALQRRSSHLGACIYILQEDAVFRPQLEPSSGVRIISPFHTLSCFSLNYNCLLHNEKPVQE